MNVCGRVYHIERQKTGFRVPIRGPGRQSAGWPAVSIHWPAKSAVGLGDDVHASSIDVVAGQNAVSVSHSRLIGGGIFLVAVPVAIFVP